MQPEPGSSALRATPARPVPAAGHCSWLARLALALHGCVIDRVAAAPAATPHPPPALPAQLYPLIDKAAMAARTGWREARQIAELVPQRLRRRLSVGSCYSDEWQCCASVSLDCGHRFPPLAP